MIRGLQCGEDEAFAPLLICANLQRETSPVEHAWPEARVALDRCAVLLARWRERRWPVAHLRRIAGPSWFDPQQDKWDWIEGFKPRPGELTFDHALPSAFSSTRFAAYIRNVRPSPNFLVGCSLDETVLATAIDGYHRGHQFHVVEDAVLCVPRAKAPDAPATHQNNVLHILQVFGERVRSEAVITPSSQARSRDALAAHSRGGRSNQ
jgi:nicotinamidase-related amidase